MFHLYSLFSFFLFSFFFILSLENNQNLKYKKKKKNPTYEVESETLNCLYIFFRGVHSEYRVKASGRCCGGNVFECVCVYIYIYIYIYIYKESTKNTNYFINNFTNC